jgi:hypothetical protein
MQIDYRGLRLIEQTLEALERRDTYEPDTQTYAIHYREVARLEDLLRHWVGDRFGIIDVGPAVEKVNEILDLFTIETED